MTPDGTTGLSGSRWWRHSAPFPHLRATSVFTPAVYRDLERQFRDVLDAGLGDAPDPDRFSRNMRHSDAYSWNFPPDLDGPLSLFYSAAWIDRLAALTGVRVTRDVNGALHHHQIGSADGTPHRDTAVGWFSDQPRPDGVNPMDLRRCSYTDGVRHDPAAAAHCTVRAVTMLFYLANPEWRSGDGGGTGLYGSADRPVGSPSVVAPPAGNSILVFANGPHSHHSFLRNVRSPRNSVVLWLHSPVDEAVERWGPSVIGRW